MNAHPRSSGMFVARWLEQAENFPSQLSLAARPLVRAAGDRYEARCRAWIACRGLASSRLPAVAGHLKEGAVDGWGERPARGCYAKRQRVVPFSAARLWAQAEAGTLVARLAIVSTARPQSFAVPDSASAVRHAPVDYCFAGSWRLLFRDFIH